MHIPGCLRPLQARTMLIMEALVLIIVIMDIGYSSIMVNGLMLLCGKHL
jgi:hypothetical protein